MHRPTARLLTVLELLQDRKMTGAELARKLEVDGRTVRRYVTTLQGMGIPVEGERGRYGAYSLKRGYKMPPLMFTDEEALGLALSLLAARGLGLAGAAPAVEGALAKLERVMPEALRVRVQSLEQTVSISVGRRAPARSGALLTLAAAAGERRMVRMRYRSGRSEETEREMDPYGVLHREGYWYAVGHCHLRGGMRLFRVDRILETAMLEKTFVLPAGLGSPEAAMRALENTSSEVVYFVEVLLETKDPDICERLPSMGLTLEQTEDGTLLQCPTRNLNWMARLLAGLDCSFTVRQPDELRKALEQRAEEISVLAKRTGKKAL